MDRPLQEMDEKQLAQVLESQCAAVRSICTHRRYDRLTSAADYLQDREALMAADHQLRVAKTHLNYYSAKHAECHRKHLVAALIALSELTAPLVARQNQTLSQQP